MRSDAIDTTYYKTTSNEAVEKANYSGILPLQEEIFRYIRKHWVVSGKSIMLYLNCDRDLLEQNLPGLFKRELVERILTKKQADEIQMTDQTIILTDVEERTIKIQEKMQEITFLYDEYNRKQRELNRSYDKYEKAREELSKL